MQLGLNLPIRSVVNVVIVDYSWEEVLSELQRCLALFANLHTVQLVSEWLHYQRRLTFVSPFQHKFKKRQYPQIRNVCVSSSTSKFLACCPNARCLTSYKNDMYRHLLEDALCCPHIRKLGLITFEENTIQGQILCFLSGGRILSNFVRLAVIAQHFKELNDITLDGYAFAKSYVRVSLVASISESFSIQITGLPRASINSASSYYQDPVLVISILVPA